MGQKIADRVKETSSSTGSGDFALLGAVQGFKAFSSICSIGDTVYYVIEGVNVDGSLTGEWETGLGTYSAANTITRTTVKDSSNGGLAVNFSAGSKHVVLSLIASQLGTYAPLDSPAFSGTPTAPTAAVDTNTTQLATTAFVINQAYLKSAVAASTYAPLASPAFTGTPIAPTAAVDTNTTQLATTAYVINQGYLKSASYTAADVLSKIKTVDGTGSGLDADLLDGHDTAYFAVQGQTMYIGTTAVAINRTTGAISLTGVSIDGSAGSVAWTNVTGRPTALSSFTNDSGYQTTAGTVTNLNGGTINPSTACVSVGSTGTQNPVTVLGDATHAAAMTFYRQGGSPYAIHAGLDTDNVFRLGGWSDGAATYRITVDASGNFVARGNVTAYSDARLKEDMSRIEGALEKVETLVGVTFRRKDTGERQTGLIAQDVQKVLPEAVTEGDNGLLALAYGNLAGLLVEAIKELRAELRELKEKA